jgi:glycosyltransferase involved in cell wall biosynthesis
MRCLLLSRYNSLAASSRIRFFQYLPFLQSQGIEVETAALLDDGYVRKLYASQARNWSTILKAYLRRFCDIFSSSRYDLLWVEAEIFPWLPAWSEIWLASRKIPYVVDYDDAAFHRYDMHRLGLIRHLLGDKIDKVMRLSSMVIAGNSYLASRARSAGARRVEVLPTVVDLNRYPRPTKSSHEDFVIGWIGSPATAHYLQLLEEVFHRVTRWENASICFVGSGPLPQTSERAQIMDWSENTEVRLLQSFNVGIMPLPNGPWEQGKCGYKLVQYMASGLPVVASPVGINKDIVEPGRNGYLAAGTEEWLASLQALWKNQDLCSQLGQEGRKKVEARYSLQITAPQLLSLLNEATR